MTIGSPPKPYSNYYGPCSNFTIVASKVSGDQSSYLVLLTRYSLILGALTVVIRVPLKGSLKGLHKGSIVRAYDIGAVIIRIGSGGPLTIL